MKVTVVGAGNSGCAHAAMLVENGHEVTLVKTSHSMHDESFAAISDTGRITCIDSTRGDLRFEAKLANVTRDIKQGLEAADVVLILTQSLQHRTLAPRISPHLRDGQVVLIIPGNMGSIMFDNELPAGRHVIFAEGESTPFDARLIAPGVVNILFKNVRNAVSFLYKKDETYLNVIHSLFGAHKYLRKNVIESTMHNPNLVVHTIGSVMSASRIEQSKGEFWMYREAFSPSIWNLINQLDKEKNQILKAFGGQESSYLDQCKWRNESDLSKDSLAVFESYAADGGPKGPADLNTRYIYEDVPMELGMLELLGKYKSIPTPITSAIITIASGLKGEDYRKVTYDLDSISKHLTRLLDEAKV